MSGPNSTRMRSMSVFHGEDTVYPQELNRRKAAIPRVSLLCLVSYAFLGVKLLTGIFSIVMASSSFSDLGTEWFKTPFSIITSTFNWVKMSSRELYPPKENGVLAF